MPQSHGMDNGTSLILLLETAADKTMMWLEILHRANLTWKLEVILKDLAHD